MHLEIKNELINIVIELFGKDYKEIDLIEYVDLFDEFGIDSILFVTLVVEIETHFNIVIPDDLLLMKNFRNIEDITLIVGDLINKKEW